MAKIHKDNNFFRQNKKISINKRRISIAIVLVLVIISIVCGVVLYKNHSNPITKVASKPIDNVYDKLVTISRSEGPDSSQKYLDGELQNAKSPEEIAKIYIMKSGEADSIDSNDNKAKSLEYAYMAEKNYPTYKSALVIARIEEWKGNIEIAIKYYKLCLERNPKDVADWSSTDNDYYQVRIDKLEKAINK